MLPTGSGELWVLRTVVRVDSRTVLRESKEGPLVLLGDLEASIELVDLGAYFVWEVPGACFSWEDPEEAQLEHHVPKRGEKVDPRPQTTRVMRDSLAKVVSVISVL